MESAHPSNTPDINEDNTPLPSYLARHVKLGFNSDDVAALITSIDSSQKSQTPSTSQLPAELLLLVLEYVPVDHVLDWRLVCRGFRDAIDGRILYHHLQRTELIGYMGARHSQPMEHLTDEQYEEIHLLRARFKCVGEGSEGIAGAQAAEPVWNGACATFAIDEEWYQSFHQVGGAAARHGDTIEDADAIWSRPLDRLELQLADEGFGTLKWCIRLNHAVLDLAFALEAGRNTFSVKVNLHKKHVKVAWRDVLLSFLKTEAALRRIMEEKQISPFTFSHAEDCLRAIRRQRLVATLCPSSKVDRHIKWSLRLLHPLFGKPRYDHRIALEDIENDATNLLLLLRREAAMSGGQLAYLRRLAADYEVMTKEVGELDQAFGEFKSHVSMSGFQLSVALPALNPCQLFRNPVAWPDDMRANVEDLVRKWKSQKKVLEQIKVLLDASNLAMTVPEDSFDDAGSEF